MKGGLNNKVNKTHIYFNDFIHSCLGTISLQMVRSDEKGCVFACKDNYIETLMHDKSIRVYSYDRTKSYYSIKYSIRVLKLINNSYRKYKGN